MPDRRRLVDPAVMGPPIRWLLSRASDDFNGASITAEFWDPHATDADNLSRSAALCGWKPLLSAATATDRRWPPQ